MAGNTYLYPVIFSVPMTHRNLKGRDKVVYLSRFARQALRASAQKSGLILENPAKDTDGVPLPDNGVYWSVSHKQAYVAGVVSTAPVAIDIEKIRPCSEALFNRIADKIEWNLAEDDPTTNFFRFWTAKETVLKATGDGIRGLSRCRIAEIIDNTQLIVSYDSREWVIEHHFFDQHIAAVVQDGRSVEWTVIG